MQKDHQHAGFPSGPPIQVLTALNVATLITEHLLMSRIYKEIMINKLCLCRNLPELLYSI